MGKPHLLCLIAAFFSDWLFCMPRVLHNYNYLQFLTGVSQRDYTQYYDHISKQHEEICRSIQEFFKKHIQYKFLDEDCKYLKAICGYASLSSLLLLSQGLVLFSLGESEISCGYSTLSSKDLELATKKILKE